MTPASVKNCKSMELANSKNGVYQDTSKTLGELLANYEKELEERRERCDWYIDEEGYLCHKKYYYEIAPDRLSENWIAHMSHKRWVDMNTFIPAYIDACRLAGVEQVKITY